MTDTNTTSYIEDLITRSQQLCERVGRISSALTIVGDRLYGQKAVEVMDIPEDHGDGAFYRFSEALELLSNEIDRCHEQANRLENL